SHVTSSADGIRVNGSTCVIDEVARTSASWRAAIQSAKRHTRQRKDCSSSIVRALGFSRQGGFQSALPNLLNSSPLRPSRRRSANGRAPKRTRSLLGERVHAFQVARRIFAPERRWATAAGPCLRTSATNLSVAAEGRPPDLPELARAP